MTGRAAPSTRAGCEPFPAPLTPFEIYMVRESIAAYPMNTTVQLELLGDADGDALARALDIALARQPLFNATVDWSDPGRPHWLPAPQRSCALHVSDWTGQPPARWGEAFDLACEPGIRAWLRRGGGRSCLSLEHHHALSDQIGFYQVVSDALAAYGCLRARGAIEARAVEKTLPERDARQLALRGRFATASQPLRRLSNLAAVASAGRGAVIPLAASPRDAARVPRENPSAIAHVELSDVAPLRELAQRSGATLNDLLLQRFLIALAQWNRSRGPAKVEGALRVLLPTNLRTAQHRDMPAANCLGYAFVTAPPGDASERAIAEQTRRIKSRGYGAAFVDLAALRFAELRRRGQLGPQLARAQTKCWATAVLSYTGNVDRYLDAALPRDALGRVAAGNLVLERLSFQPPVRPLTRVALGVLSDATQLSFALRGDRHFLASDDVHALLQLYLAGLGLPSARAEGVRAA